MRATVITASLMCVGCANAQTTSVTVRVDEQIGPISPLIYGSNHEVEGYVFTDSRRQGGNRLTGYNWKLDVSHAGKDFRHQNDGWLAKQTWWTATKKIDPNESGTPAGTIRDFHDESLERGAYSLVTVPMAGFVAGDDAGPVTTDQTAPSDRFWKVEPKSPRAREDNVVYVDEMVQTLVDVFGPANAEDRRGIHAYSLDNEPALWANTHPRLRPEHVTAKELIEKSIATAEAVKSVDPAAEVYGPALWGMTAYAHLSRAKDWPAIEESGGYDWFIDYYLDAMAKASADANRRLLDVLDVHWYWIPPKDRELTKVEAMNSSRVLYDSDHVEPNFIGQHMREYLPVIPKLQASIDQYLPGTKLAISEYDWPQTGEIYGGIAQADALGAFGKFGVYFAAYHHKVPNKPDAYVGAIFTLYRNVDGQGLAFGDTAVPVTESGDDELTVYAARRGKRGATHVILINRGEKPKTIELRLQGLDVTDARLGAWYVDASKPAVQKSKPQSLDPRDEAIHVAVDPLSVWHIVIR